MNPAIYFFSFILGWFLRNNKSLLHLVILIAYFYIDYFFDFFSAILILTSFSINILKGYNPFVKKESNTVLSIGSLFFLCGFIAMVSGNNLDYENIRIQTIKFITCIIWIALFFQTINTFDEVKKYLVVFVIIRSIEISFFGIIQYFHNSRFIDIGYYGSGDYYEKIVEAGNYRLTGLLTFDPIDCSFFLAFIIAFLFYLILDKFSMWKLLLLLLNLSALILTWSRTSFLILGTSIVLIVLTYRERFFKYLFWAIVIGSLFFYYFLDVISSRLGSEDRLTDSHNFLFRIEIYQSILNVFEQLPLLTYSRDPYAFLYSVTMKTTSTENIFFQLAIERGLIPLGLFISLILIAGRNFWKSSRNNNSSNNHLIYTLFILYCLSIVFACTFNFNYDNIFFWLLFAVSFKLLKLRNSSTERIEGIVKI